MTGHDVNKGYLVATLVLTGMFTATGTAAAKQGGSPPVTAEKQSGELVHAPVTFWLFPHVGSRGMVSDRLETNVALSLGVSGYARLRGADLGLVGSMVTRQMDGLQATVGFNSAARGRGVQLAVGANLVSRRMDGLQASVGFNSAARGRGVQLAVGANLMSRQMDGMQASVGYNHAGSLRGAQIGLVNFGGHVRGAQIGLINVGSKVKGTQIGLLNLANESDSPIGLVNLVRNGQHNFALWSSDSAPVNAGFKLGGRYVYSLIAAGLQPTSDKTRWMVGLGLGGHIPLGQRFFIETDLVGWHINDDEAWTNELNLLSKLRVLGGYRVADHFSVFAGASLNVLTTRVDDGADFGLIVGKRLTSDNASTTVRLWPGFIAGIQI